MREWNYMRFRLPGLFLALTLAAVSQTLSIRQLLQFLQSSAHLVKEGKQTDKETADYLSRAKLSERLDDHTLEQIQGTVAVGPKTLAVLRALRDKSQALAAAQPVTEEAKPQLPPPPSSEEQGAIINEVRQYALNYSRNLPDFICTQVTRRAVAPLPGTKYGGRAGSDPSWYPMDTLTIRLSYFEQKENYKLILVNNTVTTQDYEKIGGPKAFGDFGSLMKEIFEPRTQARFEWDHWGTLRGQRVMAFSYRVGREQSQYHLVVPDAGRQIVTAYHGLVEVDAKSHVVLRIIVEAEQIPPDFPIRSAKTTLDYDYTDLSGYTFLLPLKSEVLMSGGESMQRLSEDFRRYSKYSAESAIRFDTDTPPPVEEEKTKEVNCSDPKNAKDPKCRQ